MTRIAGVFARAYRSPAWIPALSLVAVLALLLSVVLLIAFFRDEAAEDRARREVDIRACERQNTARGEDVDLAGSTEDLIRGILIEFASDDERVFARLEDEFDAYRDDVAQTEALIVDCAMEVPGS